MSSLFGTSPTYVGVDPQRFDGAVLVRAISDRGESVTLEMETLPAPDVPDDATICGVDGIRSSWTEGQRTAEALRTLRAPLGLLQRARVEDGVVIDPVTALAHAVAAGVPGATATIVVVDEGVGIYRLHGNRLDPIVRLGAGHPPVVGGASLDQPPYRCAGPGVLLEIVATCCGESFADLDLHAALPDLPVAIGDAAFATGYAEWRARVIADPAIFGGRAELAASALGVAMRDIVRLGATAAQLSPDAPLCFVGSVWDIPCLRRHTAERFPSASIMIPSVETWALGAGVLGVWRSHPEPVSRLGPSPEPRAQARPVRSSAPPRRCASPTGIAIETAPQTAVRTFADLFSPVSAERFFEAFADQQPLQICGSADRFEGVLDGDRWLAHAHETHRDHPYADPYALGIPRLSVFYRGAYFPVGPPTSPLPPHWERARGWKEAHVHWSSIGRPETLRLSGVQFKDAGVRDLLWQLHALFGTHCTVNAYYSPGGGDHGLSYHYDDTHVVVLQIEGSKHWKIGRAPVRSPGERARTLSDLENGRGPEGADVWLSKGDVLYIPADTWHRVVALDGPSLHLTFGARRQTGVEFLTWLGERLASDPVLYATTAHLAEGGDPSLEISRHQLAGIVQRVHEQIAADGLVERFVADSVAQARHKTEMGALR